MIRRLRFLYKLITVAFILSLLTLVVPTQSARADTIVSFPDPNLDAAIRSAIDKPTGDIYQSDLDGLTSLMVYRGGITDLTGMEYCTSLTYLDLWGNQINSLTPLAGLTGLTELNLSETLISDISPLAGLTNLTYLDLWGNQISDLTPLAGLTNLTALYFYWNQISDISPLSGLTNLTSLDLSSNQISDISPLSGLSSLTALDLSGNPIGDISPLSGLTSLTSLDLWGNQISDISPLADLTSLIALDLVGNQISALSPLTGLTNLTYLNLWDNQISDLEPLVDNAGISDGDAIYLEGNPLSITSLNFHIPQLEGRGVYVRYDVPVVTFPDPNLEAAIRSKIGKPSGDIFSTDLSGFVTFDASNMDITDLTGMEYCTNLCMLTLSGNQINNLSPLANLPYLWELWLSDNQVIDISPLAGLTSLTALDLSGNRISDIEPLVDNEGLSAGDTVFLLGNPLSTISIDIYVPELELRGVNVIIALPPGVVTEAASEVTANTVTLNGDLNDLGYALSVYVSFEWGMGDYIYETTPQLMETIGPFSATLDSLSPGTYLFRAKAVGDGTAYGNDMIFIINSPPVAKDDIASTDEDTAVIIDVLANDSDVDDDTLYVSNVTNGTHGTVINNGIDVTYTPDPNWNGIDTFTYAVTDGNGGSDTATVTVTVNSVNDAPVAANDIASTDEDTMVTIEVLINDSDIEGDTLNVSNVTNGNHGNVVNNGTDVTYTPDPDWNGIDTFTYDVSDGNGGSDTATVTVTVNPVNDAPVAVDDSTSTDEDTLVTIELLLNDSDVDGDTLYISSVTDGNHGTVVNNGTDVTYTPDPDWNGIDTFTYDVSDGNGASDTATVTVTVNAINDAPVAIDDVYMAERRTTLTVPAPGVLANDADVDYDTLTAILVTGPANGSLVLNANGSFTYTPAANNKTGDSFTYKANDGTVDSNEATVTITMDTAGANTAPEIGITGSPIVDEGELMTFTITGTDDTPLQGLTYSATGLPEGAVFNENTGLFEWIPDYTQAGLHDIIFTVSDGELSDSMTVTCTVTDVWNITSLTSTKIKPGDIAEVKFSLTDANGTFVTDITDLTVTIFDEYNTSETSIAYESQSEECYYTTYQTSTTKMTYLVEVHQGDLLVGTFTFRTK